MFAVYKTKIVSYPQILPKYILKDLCSRQMVVFPKSEIRALPFMKYPDLSIGISETITMCNLFRSCAV